MPQPGDTLQPSPAGPFATAARSDEPRARTVWIARGLAAFADVLQIALFPLFGPGFASPANLALDAAMVFALTKLVGFHWSYLPGAALELVPGMDLAPTWTAAVLLSTGRIGKARKWFFVGAALLAGIVIMLIVWLWQGPPMLKR